MNSFWSWIEEFFETHDDIPPKAVNAIIAVGCDVSADGTGPSPMSRAIAERVLELSQTHPNKCMIFAGGYRYPAASQNPCESVHMYNVISRRAPIADIQIETESNRTYLNADETLKIMHSLSYTSAIVVAQQWHARRVRATFRKRWKDKGIRIYVIKARSTYGACSQKRLHHFVKFVLWDTLAYLYGILKGYN
ncbi:MAG: YdcF family protein [Patescibacteria group bacterium]